MEKINKPKIVTFEYSLIDYSVPAKEWEVSKVLELTIDEAHSLNRGLAMNGTTKRYIKLDDK
tara:strand:- start:426 stop:611 length:186 start_codon:yes stop_codon:yes gene_type:complete